MRIDDLESVRERVRSEAVALIEAYRRSMRMSELGEMCGLSRATMYNVASGKSAHLETLLRIRDGLRRLEGE